MKRFPRCTEQRSVDYCNIAKAVFPLSVGNTAFLNAQDAAKIVRGSKTFVADKTLAEVNAGSARLKFAYSSFLRKDNMI